MLRYHKEKKEHRKFLDMLETTYPLAFIANKIGASGNKNFLPQKKKTFKNSKIIII